MNDPFYWHQLIPALNQGLVMTILLIIPAALGGILMGLLVGSLRAYGGAILKPLADSYAALFRGTPLVVQLFTLYYGLPNLGIYFTPYSAAVLGFILCSGAYHSEYIRGSLFSIKKGQLAAAHALGFSTFKALIWIIVPQAMRRALPGCGNEFIYLIKYSSLAYIVTCIELTGSAKNVASLTFRFTEAFTVAGVYYLVMVTLATLALRKLETKLAIPGFGQG